MEMTNSSVNSGAFVSYNAKCRYNSSIMVNYVYFSCAGRERFFFRLYYLVLWETNASCPCYSMLLFVPRRCFCCGSNCFDVCCLLLMYVFYILSSDNRVTACWGIAAHSAYNMFS